MKSVCPIVAALTLVCAAPSEAAAPGAAVVLDPEAGAHRSRIERLLRANEPVAEIHLETHPADAELELVYVRATAARIRERVAAPVRLLLPSLREGDVILVRAHRHGHRIRELTLQAGQLPTRLLIPLEPLPNTLVAAAYVELVGRRLLMLWTEEPARIRVQRAGDSVDVILAETWTTLAPSPGVRHESVGEDLFVRVAVAADAAERSELRAHQTRDAARGLERIVVEWVPRDGGLAGTLRARAGLAALGPLHVDACSRSFEDRLREGVPESSLARGLAPTGRFTDAIHRAALRRLGELTPGGWVELVDGTRFDPKRPREADFVTSRASEARGYLALLSAFVREVTPAARADDVFASLIAPDLPATEVGAVIAAAREAEQTCRRDPDVQAGRSPARSEL